MDLKQCSASKYTSGNVIILYKYDFFNIKKVGKHLNSNQMVAKIASPTSPQVVQ